jgi:ABC-type nickel/cobalt efflux system permease component RcnA
MINYINDFPLFVGILAAIIHVLSGPDHLAAVGPIVIQKNNKSWLVGFAWAIGHIAGMAIIGVLFYYFRNFIPIEFISGQSEKMVGLILIVIGLWVFYKLAYQKTESKHSHIHIHQDKSGSVYAHYHPHEHTEEESHEHKHSSKQSVYTVFGIGTLHGFAGISHLVSLLPTLAFSTQTAAIMYLSGFAAGTIIAMVFFSIVLGVVSQKVTNKGTHKPYEYLNALAATIAIFVGIFWIYQSW